MDSRSRQSAVYKVVQGLGLSQFGGDTNANCNKRLWWPINLSIGWVGDSLRAIVGLRQLKASQTIQRGKAIGKMSHQLRRYFFLIAE